MMLKSSTSRTVLVATILPATITKVNEIKIPFLKFGRNLEITGNLRIFELISTDEHFGINIL
jgi:hypothetical protein